MDKYLLYKNTRIRYRDSGKGTAVVLLHGFLERLEMWEDFSGNLGSYRVIPIDLLGHGETESIGYVHSMEMMAEYVKAVISELGLKKYILVGHSMGGYVALALAEKFPENIKGLCLFHSTSRPDSEEKKVNRDRAIDIVKSNHESFIKNAIPMLFRPKNRKIFKKEVDVAKEQALTTSQQSVIAALEGMKIRPDRSAVLQSENFKKLLVIGKYDTALDYESLIDLANSSKELEMEEYPIGHMGHIEERDATLDALKKFIKSC